MKMLIQILLITFLIYFPNYSFAQENMETQPLELPNYVIEGKGQINVQTGIKQSTGTINKLTKAELDSINSLRKEQITLLPPKPMPTHVYSIHRNIGFISGSLGSYLSPVLNAGYEFAVNDYNFYATGNFESSKGDAKNSEYLKIGAALRSEVTAPDKYFIFGGSKTISNLLFNYNNYNLYSARTAPSRDLFQLGINTESKGDFANYSFSTGASYSLLAVATQGYSNLTDHEIKGHLNITHRFNQFEIGGNVHFDLNSYKGNWMSFVAIAVSGKTSIDKIIVESNAGIQLANTTSDATLFNLLFDIIAKYRINHLLTIVGKFENTLDNNDFQKHIQYNPYLSDAIYIDFPLRTELKGQINYHPDVNLFLSAGTSFGISSRTPYFANPYTTVFIIQYGSSVNVSLFSEAQWNISNSDLFNYNVNYKISRISDNNTPYIAPLTANLQYQRNWTDEFLTTVGVTYIDKRFADLANTIELPSYIDLHIGADYKLNNNFKLFIKVNNILNENIYIWNGYRERGLFFGAGITYLF